MYWVKTNDWQTYILILLILNQVQSFSLRPAFTVTSTPNTRISLSRTIHQWTSSCRPLSILNIGESSTNNLPLNNENDEIDAWKLRSMTFKQLDRSMEPQLLSEFLMEIGACSVSITDHDRDSDLEQPIFREPGNSKDSAGSIDLEAGPEEWAAIICGDAAVGKNLWMRCDVTAHFAATFDLQGIADMVRYTFNLATMPRYDVDDVPDKDWVVHVQSSWKPIIVSGLILRFPWHTQEDVLETVEEYSNGDGQSLKEVHDFVQLQLEGGVAFGTGEHPTTQLCLEWIVDTVQNSENNIANFLDYGAGSGVLGLGACALSNKIKSVGVEIDADAICIANFNAEANNLNMKSYLPKLHDNDDESKSVVMKALKRTSVDVLPEELSGKLYDACAANILAGPLIHLSEVISNMVRPGGHLGLSGILARQGNEVVEAYSEYFDDVKVAKEDSGWVLVTGTRKI